MKNKTNTQINTHDIITKTLQITVFTLCWLYIMTKFILLKVAIKLKEQER